MSPSRVSPLIPRLAVLACAALLLAACNSSDDPPAASVTGSAGVTGSTGAAASPGASATKYSAADFAKTSEYCPPVQIRQGTEALSIYERGHEDDATFARFQATIVKTARQCTIAGGLLTVKVGVGGRVVAGPKGGAGTISLPLRIAVAKQFGGKAPLYSQLFKVAVTVSPPDFSGEFSQVYDQVSVQITPDDRDLIVYVGFDEGKKPDSKVSLD
jgi:hypothetical protein